MCATDGYNLMDIVKNVKRRQQTSVDLVDFLRQTGIGCGVAALTTPSASVFLRRFYGQTRSTESIVPDT